MARIKNILEAFEKIVELSKNSKLDKDFQAKVTAEVRYASRKLHLSTIQTILLALFVDRSEDNNIRLSELAAVTGCSTTKMLQLAEDISVLEKLRYIRKSTGHNNLTFRVPLKALFSLQKNEAYVFVPEPVEDLQSFFDFFGRLKKEKDDEELNYASLKEQTMGALGKINNTFFAKELSRMHFDEDDVILFVFMAYLYIDSNDDNITFYDIDDLFDNYEIPTWCKRSLRSQSSMLFSKGLIENANEDGMARKDSFRLTSKAKEELLAELDLNGMGKSDAGLIKAETLVEKHLVYNNTEKELIHELGSLLSEPRFSEVHSRLRKAGMRSGFCCIFYGAPGTGKTETVYQLARQTGRAIMRVDVDKIKSCWVGESEKNIKSLFNRYRNICKSSTIAPILLFNEADAVLGVRMEGASRAVDKMENSIQNIILQEMETLEGIMIATTNLTGNLDKAFERRFLYKVRFDKPTIDARTKIWQTMMPDITVEEAYSIASQFDFSGGEIENIARKAMMAEILNGIKPTIKDIQKLCSEEKINKSETSKVGFAI